MKETLIKPSKPDDFVAVQCHEVRQLFTAKLLGYYFGDLPQLQADIVLHFDNPSNPGLHNAITVPVQECGGIDPQTEQPIGTWFALAVPKWDVVGDLPGFIDLVQMEAMKAKGLIKEGMH